MVCPLLQVHGNAVMSKHSITTSVIRLLFGSRPTAVARFVVAVVVDPVNLVLGRWLASHIFQEVRERVEPSLTDCNAALPVAVITAVGFAKTSSAHGYPRAILWRGKSSQAFAMFPTCGSSSRMVVRHARSPKTGVLRTAFHAPTRKAVRIVEREVSYG
jgi:hypothetical protein